MPQVLSKTLREVQSFLPNINKNLLEKALFYFKSDLDIDKIIEVIQILSRFRVDEVTVISYIIFLSIKLKIQDEDFELNDIKNGLIDNFGKEVFEIVKLLYSFEIIPVNLEGSGVENLRMMFLAMAKDIRVVLIRLAMNLQVLSNLDKIKDLEKCKIFARQAIEIYIPVAARLGIYTIKSEMEDLAFKYLYTDLYNPIYKEIEKYKKKSKEYINDIKKKLIQVLQKEGINGKVYGRVKNIYSIYKKIDKRNLTSINEIFDILALRIILPDIEKNGQEFTGHLYSLLGLIHREFTLVENRFKDYIANPKYNGYRSLHTTVRNLSTIEPHQAVEIQIRTESMHKEAEFGIASHWLYKQNVKIDSLDVKNTYTDIKRQIEWIKILANFHENKSKNISETEIFGDKVFVMTPLGEVKALPKGSTPVDFAYEVDIDLGHMCSSARVNGESVPLNFELKNGDLVEIIKKNQEKPNRYWMQFVKTEKAKNAISSWFQGIEYEKFLKKGKKKVNEILIKMGRPALDAYLSLLKNYKAKDISYKEREILLQQVGKDEIQALELLQDVLPEEIISSYMRQKKGLVSNDFGKSKTLSDTILVGGEANLLYKIASCCNPSIKDKIVGYVTRGMGITVHKADCNILKNIDKERIIEVSWSENGNKEDKKKYQVQVDVEFIDRIGFLRDIAAKVSSFNCNILDFKFKSQKENKIKRRLFFEVHNLKQFKEVATALMTVEGVTNVS